MILSLFIREYIILIVTEHTQKERLGF
uniref:Uncharacterized protein n=1 Tax=Arundo donax TaxID=35708 RepID=A0A0A9FSQ1_ARUDO